jgi:hypothetical protein
MLTRYDAKLDLSAISDTDAGPLLSQWQPIRIGARTGTQTSILPLAISLGLCAKTRAHFRGDSLIANSLVQFVTRELIYREVLSDPNEPSGKTANAAFNQFLGPHARLSPNLQQTLYAVTTPGRYTSESSVPERQNTSMQELAVRAVDDLLVGAMAAIRLGEGAPPGTTGLVTGHFGRAFRTAVCASSELWSECLTALIRRSVVAWSRFGEVPELRSAVGEFGFEQKSDLFLLAVVSEQPDEQSSDLATRSRVAVYRVTEWFNSNPDLVATMAAAVSVTISLVSVAFTLENEEPDPETFVTTLGAQADLLLGNS